MAFSGSGVLVSPGHSLPGLPDSRISPGKGANSDFLPSPGVWIRFGAFLAYTGLKRAFRHSGHFRAFRWSTPFFAL